jgi:hypothetical protein
MRLSPSKGPPVPWHLRNPSRDYDQDGREITPATVANVQKNGARGIIARCACNHEALIPFEGLHSDWYVPDIALRLRCTACGGKRIGDVPGLDGRWRSGRSEARLGWQFALFRGNLFARDAGKEVGQKLITRAIVTRFGDASLEQARHCHPTALRGDRQGCCEIQSAMKLRCSPVGLLVAEVEA